MPRLKGELQTTIEDPTTCEGLADFVCGDGTQHAEDVVEAIVRQIRAGERPSATFLVTRVLPSGALVGISAIQWRGVVVEHPDFPSDAYQDAAYIAVLSLHKSYRCRGERWTCCRGRPLSEVLLREALTHIALTAGTSFIPPVQAFVDPNNDPCLDLIRDHGFEVQMEWPEELLLIRGRDLPLSATPIATIAPCQTAHANDPETPTNLESS